MLQKHEVKTYLAPTTFRERKKSVDIDNWSGVYTDGKPVAFFSSYWNANKFKNKLDKEQMDYLAAKLGVTDIKDAIKDLQKEVNGTDDDEDLDDDF